MRPGERISRLGGKKSDDRLRRIGQIDAGLLSAHVGGPGPRRFLANLPDYVGDSVEEASLALHAFGQHKPVEYFPAFAPDALVAAPIADEFKFEINRSRKRWNRFVQILFAKKD